MVRKRTQFVLMCLGFILAVAVPTTMKKNAGTVAVGRANATQTAQALQIPKMAEAPQVAVAKAITQTLTSTAEATLAKDVANQIAAGDQKAAAKHNIQAFRGEVNGLVTNADKSAATLSAANNAQMADAVAETFAAMAEVRVEKKNAQFVEKGFLKRAITQQQFGVTTGGTYSVILPNEVATYTNATQPQFSGKEVADAPHLAAGIAVTTAQFAQKAVCQTTTAHAAMVT